MKALVKAQAQIGIAMQDVPKPTIGPTDILIRVRKTAICGTDIHIYNWDPWAERTVPIPMVIGHEFCGEVVELGEAVRGLDVGDRVSGEGHIVCGHCRNCRAGKRHLCHNSLGVGTTRPGAFAEYVAIPAVNAFPLPPTVPDQIAAFLDPLGNATHTALSFDLVGEDVLITGAGPIGIMATAIARHVGARHIVITDINDYRLAIAKKMGATVALNVAHRSIEDVQSDLGMTEGFDVGMEMSGNGDAFRALLTNMNHGGRVAILGIPPSDTSIDWDMVIFKGLVLKGIYGREMFETWYKMTAMLQGGLRVDPVLTHQYAAADFEEAFQVMRSGDCGKVVLDWD